LERLRGVDEGDRSSPHRSRGTASTAGSSRPRIRRSLRASTEKIEQAVQSEEFGPVARSAAPLGRAKRGDEARRRRSTTVSRREARRGGRPRSQPVRSSHGRAQPSETREVLRRTRTKLLNIRIEHVPVKFGPDSMYKTWEGRRPRRSTSTRRLFESRSSDVQRAGRCRCLDQAQHRRGRGRVPEPRKQACRRTCSRSNPTSSATSATSRWPRSEKSSWCRPFEGACVDRRAGLDRRRH
jgi:hypothetical protein